MTPEKAIETIKTAIAEIEWEYPMDYAVAFETAISALEKQIPKKPINQRLASGIIGDYGIMQGECLCCGENVIGNYYGEYCGCCGQALDWSDEK